LAIKNLQFKIVAIKSQARLRRHKSKIFTIYVVKINRFEYVLYNFVIKKKHICRRDATPFIHYHIGVFKCD
jgi:hypothetical protein